jgi:hypothetical protein
MWGRIEGDAKVLQTMKVKWGMVIVEVEHKRVDGGKLTCCSNLIYVASILYNSTLAFEPIGW